MYGKTVVACSLTINDAYVAGAGIALSSAGSASQDGHRNPVGEQMNRPRKRKLATQKEFEAFLHLFEKVVLKRSLKNVRARKRSKLKLA